MIKIPLTRQQFNAKAAQLKEEHGISLETDSGIITKYGCTLDYEYDGVELTLQVKDKPFLFSTAHVEAIVSGWLSSKPSTSSGVVAAVAMVLFAIFCVCAPVAKAQTVSQSVSTIYLGGVSYNPSADQKVAGTAIAAHAANTSGTYTYTVADFLPGANKTVTTNIAAGVAQKIVTLAGYDVFGTGSVGPSFSSTAFGWSWGSGLIVPVRVKPNWYLAPNARFLKSSVSGGAGYQVIVGVAFGWGSSSAPSQSSQQSDQPLPSVTLTRN